MGAPQELGRLVHDLLTDGDDGRSVGCDGGGPEHLDGLHPSEARGVPDPHDVALAAAKSDVVIMHPGPMNRGTEIDSGIADDTNRSVILDQVELGVAVRMAVLDALLGETELEMEAAP